MQNDQYYGNVETSGRAATERVAVETRDERSAMSAKRPLLSRSWRVVEKRFEDVGEMKVIWVE